MSAFALEDGVVYHTYSAYSRGLDGLWGMYQWLDRAPQGRNEARGPTTRSTGSAATTSITAQTRPANNQTRVTGPPAHNHPDQFGRNAGSQASGQVVK